MATPFTNTVGSASITTEFSLPNNSTTLTPQTTAVELEVYLNFSAMAAGDEYRVRLYEKINGGSQVVVYPATVVGPTPSLVIPSHRLVEGWDVTVTLMAGSASTVNWALRSNVGDVNVLTIANNAITAAAAAADFGTEVAAAVAAALTIPSAATIASTVWATVSEGAETFAHQMRLMRARLLGKATVQDGDGAYTYRDAADSKNRIVANRTGTARTVSSTDGT